jgi:hydroxyacylglutathione hydrolase
LTGVDVQSFGDEGLGNSAYLVDLGDGRGLTVDVSVDLREIRRAAQHSGLIIAFAADTHLHADFLSGARQLAARDDARILSSATGGREFAHTGLHDGDEVDLGGLRLRAVATPGHTHEHLAFVLVDGDRPVGVFTGGSLLVGAAARTDLVSPDQTESLARRQYASIRRLAELPDDVAVWPTHGSGSFCAAPSGARRTSTIGHELATNPLLQATDEDSFVGELLDTLGSYPPYFRRLAEVNRRGQSVRDQPPVLASLGVEEVLAMRSAGAQLVDVRPVPEFATAHIPGALSIPLRPAFVSWLGWLVEPDLPVILIRDRDQDPDEITWPAAKIGYDNLAGELAGGIDAWTATGRPTSSIGLLRPDQVDAGNVLDVRQAAEYASGHVSGAVNVELGDLGDRLEELPAGPTVVMCGHGERAMGAASLLERAGRRDLAVVVGSPEDVTAAAGRRLETGE